MHDDEPNPVELEAQEQAEDAADVKAAAEALAESDERIPWEQVKQELKLAEDTQSFPDTNPEHAVEAFLTQWTLGRDPRQSNAIEAANAFYGGSVSTPEQFDLVRRVWRRMYGSGDATGPEV